jgi:hypothetical protein
MLTSGITNLTALNLSEDRQETLKPGGEVIRCLADAALKIGDVVYWSSPLSVNKSATVTNYASFAGVVVGGEALGADEVFLDGSLVDTTAAAADGDWVLIQTTGVAYVIAGAAIASVGPVIASAVTSGRIASGTTAGQMLGTLLEAAAGAASVVRIFIDHR